MRETFKELFLLAASLSAMVGHADSGDSSPFLLDTAEGTRIATEGEAIPIAYSPHWGYAAECSIAIDGNRLLSTAEEGTTTWTPQGVGGHTLTHTAGGETLTARFAVLGDDVAVHAGTLGTSETWGNKVHLVTSPLTVPSGVVLTIQAGAVVKFMPGASLTVASGGSCTARGVIFTHVNDDTVGGDTLMDGDSAGAKMGDYTITGSITDDDSTEYRYMPPQTLQSNISSNTRLRGYRTYIVSNSVTVASGATLTLQPGTILKFNTGCSLTVNGTLDAQGTRAAPIVFTSLKDDAHGGDTNGDGDKTRPTGGDWRYIYVSGTANLKYCKAMYGAPSNETGIIETTGSGSLVMDSCIVAHALYDGIWNWGGSISVKNTIITDTGWASAPYRGTKNEYVNCVFYGNNVGMCYWSNWNGSTLYKNCIFAECAKGWCELGSNSYGDPSSRVNVSNCLFWNPVGFSAQSCGIVGSNGNIWGDPIFVDAENGDFRLQKGSPCINAGDAAYAPEFDYYGQPHDDAPDIGLYEFTGGMSANDLAAVGGSPSSATAATIGDTLTISYEVANVGKQAINGSWRDKVSLVSVDGGYSIDLGTAVQTATLAVGATSTFNASFTVPPEAEGTWRMAVNVNVERDIYEGANVTNNVATSEGTIEISLPARAASDGFSGTTTKGAPASAKFALDGAEPMVARINAPAGTVVYLGSGFMPSASSYSARAVVGADGGLIGIPAGVTTAYILVETTSSKGAAFTMTLESAALAVQSVTPTTLPYTGTTGLVIDGANFAEGCTVVVERAASASGTGEPPVLLSTVVSPTRMTAQIDCSRLTAGATYDVKVVGADGATATLPNAVTVANVPAAPKLKATLDAPASVRRGRTLTVYIDYENVGNADLPAPIFELISEGQVFKIDGAVYTNSVKVMGLSAEAPVGTLRPGEPQRLGIPVTILAENVKWKLRSYHAAQEGAKKEITLGQFLDPAWVWRHSKGDGAVKVSALRDAFGRTWAEFYSNIGTFASETLSENQMTTSFAGLVAEFSSVIYWNICAPEPGGIGELVDEESWASAEESDAEFASTPKGVSMRTANATMLIHPAPVTDSTRGDYKKDNSLDGDVWCWNGSGWVLLYSDQADMKINGVTTRRTGLVTEMGGTSSDTSVFKPGRKTVMICHGMQNSIQQKWISTMADALKKREGDVNVLAVDWGGNADSGIPQISAMGINNAADEAYPRLVAAGVTAGSLTLIGHSHGGHVAARLAGKKCFGKVKRLIGLDVSTEDLGVQVLNLTSYWLGGKADQKLFYKSSWNMSLASDDSNELDADFNFALFEDGDFYEEPYHKGSINYFNANEREKRRHSNAYEWFIPTIRHKGFNWGYNFTDTESTCPQWTARTVMETHPGRKRFAGVINATKQKLEMAARPNDEIETEKDDWAFAALMLGIGVGSDFKPSTYIDNLHENTLRTIDYAAVSLDVRTAGDDGSQLEGMALRTGGGKGNRVVLGYRNRADNTSVPWDDLPKLKTHHPGMENNSAYLPWNKGIGRKDEAIANSLWLARVSDIEGGEAIFSALKAGGELTDEQFGETWLVARLLARREGTEQNFAKPGSDTRTEPFEDVMVNPFLFDTRLGCDEDGKPLEEGEKCILIGLAGENSGNGVVYTFDLALQRNNFIAQAVTVYDGELGIPVIRKAQERKQTALSLMSVRSAKASSSEDDWMSEVAIDVDAAKNGTWSVVLDGSKSIFPYGVSAQYWWFDHNVEIASRSSTATFGGTLPESVDYDETKVWLAISDNENAKWAECTLRITRTLPDDPGEEEDSDSSNEPKSCDPNEMVGDEGVGEARYVKPGQELTYTIYFENKSDADAAAACVEVFNPLNEWLDWSSLTMLDVGYNGNVDNGLSGLTEGMSEKTMDGTNVSVRTEFAVAYYDEDGNVLDENALAARSTMEGVYARAEWYLRIIDPNGDSDGWPLDMTGGFLPPNDEETHCGEGHIRYKIRVRDDAPGNVMIVNSATIVFDKFNDPIETDPAWWNTVGSKGAAFAESEVEANEGELATIKVMGGSADAAASVKVYLTYNTAAAADVDLKTGAVDGATPKGGLKFPLTLSWEAGEIGEKVITIPVKVDKTVEGDEFFTLQLAEAEGMELGEERVCTVTIRDTTVAAGKETLQDAVNNAIVKMSTSGKGKWAYAAVGTGGEAAPGKTASASAASPILKAGQTADLKAAAVKGSGTLTFDVRVANPNLEGESPEAADGAAKTVLTLLDGKAELLAWTNETDWTSASYTVEEAKATSHAFMWRVVQGADTNAHAYVANVAWSPADTEMRAITLSVEPAEGGTAAGSGVYPDKTKLSLVATANVGYEFIGWYDGETLFDAKAKPSVTITNDLALTARFEKIPYIRGLADPADGGKVSGSGLCARGKKVTLKASANKNFTFLGWCQVTGNGEQGTGNGYVATTPSLVIDRSAKPTASSKTSMTITDIDGDVTYYAVFKSDPEIFVTVDATDGTGAEPTGKGAGKYVAGTITGMGKYAPGKTKIALKAAANKGYVFAGWLDANGELLTKDATYAIATMGESDMEYTAKFVTADEDKASIELAVAMGAEAEAFGLSTNEIVSVTNFCGVAMNWPVTSGGLSETKVKVSGLPSGLKFTDKPVTSKVGSGKTAVTVTNVPASTIYGAPTAASKTDKNGNVTPSKVLFTVTTAGKSTQTFAINLYIDPLPDWAVGTFDGATYAGDSVEASGLVQAFTVAVNGKISGKLLRDDGTWTLSADSFASYDATNDVYLATVIGKNGKLLETNEVKVAASGVTGTTLSEAAVTWTAYQNLWKRADTKADMPVIKKDIKVDHELVEGDANNKLTLTFKKDGAVAFAGKVGGASVSGSSQLVLVGRDDPIAPLYQVTLYAPAKGTFAGFCRTLAVTLTLDAPNIVKDVTIGGGDAPAGSGSWFTGEFTGYGDAQFPTGGDTEFLNGLFSINVAANLSFTGTFFGTDGTNATFSGTFAKQVTDGATNYVASGVAITVRGQAMTMALECSPEPYAGGEDGFGEMWGGSDAVPGEPCIALNCAWQNIWKRGDLAAEWKPAFAAGTEKTLDLQDTWLADLSVGDSLTYAFGADGAVSITGKIYGETVNATATLDLEGLDGSNGTMHCNFFFLANGHLYQQQFTFPRQATVTAADITLDSFVRID